MASDRADQPRRSDDGPKHPEPGPAPVGPAVDVPPQTPAKTPKDPGPAPVGPAVRPGEGLTQPPR
jgi:hypothetical protein